MTAKKHTITHSHSRYGYIAKCSCGWKSPNNRNRMTAVKHATDHLHHMRGGGQWKP